METNIDIVMSRLEPYLPIIDDVLKAGFSKYKEYPKDVILDHDLSTQAHCINSHIISNAHKELDSLPDVLHFEVSQQNLWLFEEADVILRFKKTDKYGKSSNFQTPQAIAFDVGEELPGLPIAPIRLTAGYLQDVTGIEYIRSQISLPGKNSVLWNTAILRPDLRAEDLSVDENINQCFWEEVSPNYSLAV